MRRFPLVNVNIFRSDEYVYEKSKGVYFIKALIDTNYTVFNLKTEKLRNDSRPWTAVYHNSKMATDACLFDSPVFKAIITNCKMRIHDIVKD